MGNSSYGRADLGVSAMVNSMNAGNRPRSRGWRSRRSSTLQLRCSHKYRRTVQTCGFTQTHRICGPVRLLRNISSNTEASKSTRSATTHLGRGLVKRIYEPIIGRRSTKSAVRYDCKPSWRMYRLGILERDLIYLQLHVRHGERKAALSVTC
jgi:hypothetical protein